MLQKKVESILLFIKSIYVLLFVIARFWRIIAQSNRKYYALGDRLRCQEVGKQDLASRLPPGNASGGQILLFSHDPMRRISSRMRKNRGKGTTWEGKRGMGQERAGRQKEAERKKGEKKGNRSLYTSPPPDRPPVRRLLC